MSLVSGSCAAYNEETSVFLALDVRHRAIFKNVSEM